MNLVDRWVHDGCWKHTVVLKDGTRLHPTKIDLNSATRLEDGAVWPAIFCETKENDQVRSLRWINWWDVAEVHSVAAAAFVMTHPPITVNEASSPILISVEAPPPPPPAPKL